MRNHALSSEAKKALKSAVLSLRGLLEGDFDQDTFDPAQPGGDVVRQLARFGIDGNKPDSLSDDNAPDYLTDEEKKIRQRICAAIRREASLFGQPSNKLALKRGLRAFVRETSYTWINRLLGLKCMEVRGLLRDEHGEQDFVVTPSDQYGGLPRRAWRIKGQDPAKWQKAKVYELFCAAISDACRQLTEDINVLFDPDHDYGLIWPSPQALTEMLQKIQELAILPSPSTGEGKGGGSPFASHDFLGWVYQYFQTKEKEHVFEAASKKKKKIEKDDIIAATQIYTEQYMVEYLVQNTLGRLWMEMHPDSRLSGAWAYYVKQPEGNPPVRRDLKKAIDLKLMDPALGSGHFHLVAFDLLFKMYQEEIENADKPGWPEMPSVAERAEIPPAILEHNLYGMDIDARAIQLATLALFMKARETGFSGPIRAIHFVTANAAPFDSPSWHEFIKDLSDKGRHSVARVLAILGAQLKNLDEYGPLLRIEEEMERVVHEERKKWFVQTKASWEQDYLFSQMAKPLQQKIPFEEGITDGTFFENLAPVIEKELDDFYLTARQNGLAEDAILAADADRGFDFLRLCMERYDVVYTNPPYMGSKNMGKQLKDFVARAYPQGKRDLYSAFILRCCEMAEKDGCVGMVTQQSWLFLSSFADLRALPEEKVKKSRDIFTGVLREMTIQTIAHLGPGAFSEIGGEVVNTVLFTLRHAPPLEGHKLCTFRVTGVSDPVKKAAFLRESMKETGSSARIEQAIFLGIPATPIIYWIRPYFAELLRDWPKLREKVTIRDGISTGGTDRALRFHWECPSNQRWRKHEKGGGYAKWLGLGHYLIDWLGEGDVIRQQKGGFIRNASFFGKHGLVYSRMAQGSLGARLLKCWSFDTATRAVFSLDSRVDLYGIMAILNTRTTSYFLRLLVQGFDFSGGYTEQIPIPDNQSLLSRVLPSICLALKNLMLQFDCTDPGFIDIAPASGRAFGAHDTIIESILLACEGIIEQEVFKDYLISGEDREAILAETGTPAGWYPLISGYEVFPALPKGLPEISKQIFEIVDRHKRLNIDDHDITILKQRLRSLYENGPGAREHAEEQQDFHFHEEEEVEIEAGAYIPIPPETFLEELSQKLEIHPISVYWLLKEMREKEALRCPPEEKRRSEDYLSVMIIRMLGYQWPKQVEAGEPLPDWVDDDGIIPLNEGLGEPTLLDRVRERFGADFGEEKEATIEAEFGNIVGKSLGRWLEEEFFQRHVKQFKNRPIAWHIVSDPSVADSGGGPPAKGRKKAAKKKRSPAFSVMVHYHRLVDGEKGYRMLQLLRNKYLEKLITQTHTELEGLRGKGADPEIFDRIAELDRRMIELEHFKEKLERIQEGKDPEARIHVRWKGHDEQPKGWRPDINDGVKINIAPWERLGMFPVKKIAGNVEMVE